MESLATSASSTLISDTFTANSVPTKARIVLFAEISDDLNTDVTVSATRDNTTFNAITLVRWKIVGSNQTAENKIHGVALQWG